MTVMVEEVETVSDALFACSYTWAHGNTFKRADVDLVIQQHGNPATRYGQLAASLKRISEMTYEDLCDAGYLDTDRQKMIDKRRAAMMEIIGEAELNDWLSDLKRIQRAFPDARTGERRSKLPLSRGSDGYDVNQSYVVKHMLPAQSLCSIYGPSGSYKSFLAVSWACHIAAGVPWSGKRVAAGAVLYIVGEGGVGVPRRIKAWENVHQQQVENLWLVNRPVFPVRESEVNEVILTAKQITEESTLPVRLIVIDTLARCFGGNDENDARDMGAFIEGCDVIKQKTGATVLVVHHSGKDESKGARGSSSFRAALDAEFNVTREGEGGALILSCTKMKDAEEPKRLAYDLRHCELYTDPDGEAITSMVLRDIGREPQEADPELENASNLSGNHHALWQAVRSRTARGEPCTIAVIRDDLKATQGADNTRKNFSRWLAKLERDGLICKDGDILRPSISE